MDYKQWIQDRAEELALELYAHEYQHLPSNLQELVYFKAEAQYLDYCAMKIDMIYDRLMDYKMGV